MSPVSIRLRTVGDSFGTCAILIARNGRVLAETSVRPLGHTGAAIAEAKDIAAVRGWRLAE